MSEIRKAIIATYAEWTAMSALRSGAPIKSRRDVYTALRGVNFEVLFAEELGPINRTTFDAWHASEVKAMMERQPRLTVGWATKIINVYLKTRVYIGAQGRHHLKEMIHPPIDSGLWLGLARQFPNRPDILERTNCVSRIKDIADYECYRRIIDGCRDAAKALDCELIEVEQLWAGTEFVPSAYVESAHNGSGVTDSDYIARLQRHLANYKSSVLLVQEPGFWGRPPRAYPHILPAELRELNIIAPFREAFWRAQRQRGWKLHKYFHHLSSSQALAFNVLFLLYPEVPLRMVATRRLLGLPEGVPCQLDFEAVLDAGEGTNIDALIWTGDGTRTIIEAKLTERAFGAAPADERHLAKLANIYRPHLAGRVESSCLEPPAFFRDYQLYRNLAQVRCDSADRVLLLLPRARTQLWQHAASWCESTTLGSLRGRIRVVALEDVVIALTVDSANSDLDRAAIAEVSRKYILPAG